jgi:hypothetical protein
MTMLKVYTIRSAGPSLSNMEANVLSKLSQHDECPSTYFNRVGDPSRRFVVGRGTLP